MHRKNSGWRLKIESLSDDFSGITHSARAYNTRMTAHAKALTPYETSAQPHLAPFSSFCTGLLLRDDPS